MNTERLRRWIDLRWLFVLFGLTTLILSIHTSWQMHQTYAKMKQARYLKTSKVWRTKVESMLGGKFEANALEALVRHESALKYVSVRKGHEQWNAGKRATQICTSTPRNRRSLC